MAVRSLQRAAGGLLCVNSSCRACWNQLNGDGPGDVVAALVPQQVHVVASRVDKNVPFVVNVLRAVRVIRGDSPTCHDDQAGAGVSVPSGAAADLPLVVLHVEI